VITPDSLSPPPPAACEYALLGRIDYVQAWDIQNVMAAEIAEGRRPPTLLLLEHPHTYTFGQAGHRENLLWGERDLDARGVSVHWVDRGGDITYHGPGQLVGYPLLPLGRVDPKGHLPKADYVGYLRQLEAVLIQTLARFGLVTGQVKGLTGVWVQPDVASRCPRCPAESRRKPSKLAAIGVKVDVHGVTRHGFALNVDPDMSYWQGIVPCGLPDHPVVSLADLMWDPPSLDAAAEALVVEFGNVFGYEMHPTTLPLPQVAAD
jgi:lipoyl(octanoyl) transferase